MYILEQLKFARKRTELDNFQDEAGRIVTGATRLVSLNKLHNDICWGLLYERRQKHKLIQLQMKKRALNPEKLSSIITSEVCDRNTYTFRNAYNITRIQSRTTIYKFKSFSK